MKITSKDRSRRFRVAIKIAAIAAVIAYLVKLCIKELSIFMGLLQRSNMRLSLYYDVLYRWMNMSADGVSIAKDLEDAGIKHIAVYGLGKLGGLLLKELEHSHICVDYYINKFEETEIFIKEDVFVSEIPPIVEIHQIDAMPLIDAIIVTPVHVFDAIEADLKKVYGGKIISIDELIR